MTLFNSFRTFFMGLVEGQPGIKEVGLYGQPEVERPVVKCEDGTEIYLAIVAGYPPGGARPADAPPVTRPEGQPIKVIYRDQESRKDA